MKQLLQSMRNGKTTVADVPTPVVHPGSILVRVESSLVSAGTERMLVDFAGKSLLGKAKARPDFVLQVLDKAKREGVLNTAQAAFNRLDQPMPLGYSTSGVVEEVGKGVTGIQPGDRVACAGSHAVHAEYNLVPKNLFVKVPTGVSPDSAAFTTLGAIALHGFRLADPQVGDNIAVIGLGLLGLLVTRIALASGCRVFGTDIDPHRVKLGKNAGAFCTNRANAETAGRTFSGGKGFDAVLICADATGDDVIKLAAEICRDRGKVISIGAVGLNLTRKQFYEKEITFLVSRSYGPGRYDPAYEEDGVDYPYGYVRWTETRNMAAFLDMISTGKLEVESLISHRFVIDHAAGAYKLITHKTEEPFLGVLLTYPVHTEKPGSSITIPLARKSKPSMGLHLGVLGAGNYAQALFLPVIKKNGQIDLKSIASSSGVNARHAADKFGFSFASADENDILTDQGINVITILTRHDDHARQASVAIKNHKHVYCEKPLALDQAGLDRVQKAIKTVPDSILTVGFNRRFSPMAVRMKEFISARTEPLMANYRVNAGFLPLTHWLHDPLQGGGRIIGEACHYVDLLTFLIGRLPVSVHCLSLPDGGIYRQDNVLITLTYPDGSIANVTYLANGDKSVSKETCEIFTEGSVIKLDDFRVLELTRNGKTDRIKSGNQDKGHQAAWKSFITSIQKGGNPPIPYEEIWGVHRVVFAAVESLQSGKQVIF
jgi:predicted dehydrogenase/threonine dehydrogenase-like Zn-dependent dehydrogenase